jgi:hypothetical protein
MNMGKDLRTSMTENVRLGLQFLAGPSSVVEHINQTNAAVYCEVDQGFASRQHGRRILLGIVFRLAHLGIETTIVSAGNERRQPVSW